MNKNGLAGLIAVILILMVVGFFWFSSRIGKVIDGELECNVDDDCVRVQTGCCGCNMGGTEKCVIKSYEKNYLPKLDNCSDIICTAVYNCEIGECKCVDGKCGFD